MSILDKDISYIRTNKGIFMEEKIYDELVYRIHHLEKENERLKAEVNLLNDNRIYLNDKIDRAIEELKSWQLDCNYTQENEIYQFIINILQNGSDEE